VAGTSSKDVPLRIQEVPEIDKIDWTRLPPPDTGLPTYCLSTRLPTDTQLGRCQYHPIGLGSVPLPLGSFPRWTEQRLADHTPSGIAGLAINPVRVYWTLRDFTWEFLRLWTGSELSSSWRRLS
jgi:hypothetical protein